MWTREAYAIYKQELPKQQQEEPTAATEKIVTHPKKKSAIAATTRKRGQSGGAVRIDTPVSSASTIERAVRIGTAAAAASFASGALAEQFEFVHRQQQ